MEINASARRHDVDDVDIVHAVEHVVAEYELVDDQPESRWLVLGPNRAGLMLEIVILVLDDDRELVIHAMVMRSKYAGLLERGET